MIAETYWQLMKDPAHLGFEFTLWVLQDIILGLLLWPAIKRGIVRHDKKHHPLKENENEEVRPPSVRRGSDARRLQHDEDQHLSNYKY